MFTGIVEHIGKVKDIQHEGSNVHITIEADIAKEAYIDQSVAHNGVCLTIVSKKDQTYTVTAIAETLAKTNLGQWKIADAINLERAMKADQRLDGHFVQGHVDGTVTCLSVKEADGSWNYRFTLPEDRRNLIVNKGSVCLNGISLTVVDPDKDSFGVSIIPYTYEHTNMHDLQVNDKVNIEYDMIAKHIVKHIDAYIEGYLSNLKSNPKEELKLQK